MTDRESVIIVSPEDSGDYHWVDDFVVRDLGGGTLSVSFKVQAALFDGRTPLREIARRLAHLVERITEALGDQL